jgi:Right handed beta helix region
LMKNRMLALTVISLMLFPMAVNAATRHVPDDYVTIQGAIDAADDGDIVMIAPGTYYENLFISRISVTLASRYLDSHDEADIVQTIIDGQGDTVIDIRKVDPDMTIIGLTIQNGNDGIAAHSNFQLLHNRIIYNKDGIDYQSGGGLCQWNLFENNTDDGIDLDGACGVTIEDCTIVNNDDDGIEIRLHPYDGDTLDVIIRRNIIRGNGEDGIQFIDYGTDSNRVFRIERNLIADNAMAAVGCMGEMNTVENYEAFAIPEPIFFINNTVAGNTYGITGGNNIAILNNIFANTDGTALKEAGGQSVAAHNLFWNNGLNNTNSIWLAATCQFEDPMFGDNYSLLAGSPCIDAGASIFEWNSVDLLIGVDFRIADGAPDLGATEHEPASD